MTLAEKAGQMVQGVIGTVQKSDMTNLGLGSVLSGGGSLPSDSSILGWQKMVKTYQEGAMETRLGIPFIYGIDAVHGHSNLYGAVIFPQNIGLGAANDPELMAEMGAAVAEEMKLTHTLWNFAPCVAVAQDPRWGRTYESFSSDPQIVSRLALAYFQGQSDHGIVVNAKHFAGDGGVLYGTGEGDNLIDRGDVQLSHEEFMLLHVEPYRVLVDAGLKIVMASFSSLNGVKMSENTYYLTDVLKGDLGFEGFIVSDWEAISGLSGDSFDENVILAVNAGVDMMMEPYRYAETIDAIIDGVESGAISEDRVNDAVRRILTVKFDMGLFEDPYLENLPCEVEELGSENYRAIAKELVSKSMVLLKNEEEILPLKSGQKIYVMGPAMNDIGIQCGGWTRSWQGFADTGPKMNPGTTILEGLQEYASEYGLEIITDEARASEADVVILAVSEIPYAEFLGDSADLSLTGSLGSEGNFDAINAAKALGKPVVTLIVAGRNVLISEYINDWDGVVMCYLPGTEGDGIAAVLVGELSFTGKLPMPWYKSTSDIGSKNPVLQFEQGFGLSYP
jgi:beta-glucosidase